MLDKIVFILITSENKLIKPADLLGVSFPHNGSMGFLHFEDKGSLRPDQVICYSLKNTFLTCIFIVEIIIKGLIMRIKIQRWGNSLALRIPKAFAIQSKIREDDYVNLTLEGNKIVIEPVNEKQYSLKELVAGINKSNLHHEIDYP